MARSLSRVISSGSTRSSRARPRAGMTLIEVVLAIVILSFSTLGMARFGAQFQHKATVASDIAMASDLASQRIEMIKAHRTYADAVPTPTPPRPGIVSAYGNTTETFSVGPYAGLTRVTKAVRRQTTSTPMYDYTTVSVVVTRGAQPPLSKKTTIIAVF